MRGLVVKLAKELWLSQVCKIDNAEGATPLTTAGERAMALSSLQPMMLGH